MDIVYNAYAVERMEQRRLSQALVRKVIENSDGVIQQSKDKSIHYKKIKGREDNLIAAVAVSLASERLEVITVMVNFEVK